MSDRRDARVDGLRGLAALTVVLPHSALLLAEGPTGNARAAVVLGYSLLFALSGYLLYLPFVLEVVRNDLRVHLDAYTRNRLVRLLPAVLLVLAAGLALGVQPFADPWLLVPLPVFALALPTLWRLAQRLDDGERRVRAVVLPAALLLAIGGAGLVLDNQLRHAAPFGAGMAAAASTVGMTGRRTLRKRVWSVRRGALMVLGGAVLASIPASLARFEPAVLSVALAATVVVLRLPGQGVRGYLAATFELGPLRRAGVVSAGLVLWHVPLALVLRGQLSVEDSVEHYLAALALVLAGTWLLAELTWRFVERPALRARRPMLTRRRRPRVALPEQRPSQPDPLVVPLPPATGGKHRADVAVSAQETSPST